MRTPIQDDEAILGLLPFARIFANSIALDVRDGHMDPAQVISVAVAKHLDILDNTLAPHVVALLSEAVFAPRGSSPCGLSLIRCPSLKPLGSPGGFIIPVPSEDLLFVSQ